jgi:Protein of unknown function (DUF4058)
MPSPFPGMDPYLESPEFWSEVHNRLIVAIADDLAPNLRPKYRVAIEQRIYLSSTNGDRPLVGIPAVTLSNRSNPDSWSMATVMTPSSKPIAISLPLPEEVRESYLEIREINSSQVITVIELLSPKNKKFGEGRIAYERKRQKVLGSSTHLVEIDLLRQGKKFPLGAVAASPQYYVLVARGDRRPAADLYPFTLREPIPSFPLPLAESELEPVIELQKIFDGVYDRAGFHLAIDYKNPPSPKLNNADSQWALQFLKS